MKTKIHDIFRLILFLSFIFILFISVLYYNFWYLQKYESIFVESATQTIVEYGSANYNLNDLIGGINGNIVSVKRNLDTSKVGTQKIVLELEKDNVHKDVSIKVEIKDTVAPIIELEQQSIVIEQGENFELKDNIKRVYDFIDGDLIFKEQDDLKDGYYTIDSNFNNNICGNYEVVVFAVDKHNNSTSTTFNVIVRNSSAALKIVNLAESLVGLPYVYGGTTPSGFDCSGFVQYVYKQVGLKVSRGASTQIYDGFAVSFEQMMPGDIISWGYSDGTVTHSAIYIGDGKMVHAANPNQGVTISRVENWIRTSGVQILGVRRLA